MILRGHWLVRILEGPRRFARMLKFALSAGRAPELRHVCRSQLRCSRKRRRIRTCNLDHAPRPWKDRESEAVQLYNSGHQVKAETQA